MTAAVPLLKLVPPAAAQPALTFPRLEPAAVLRRLCLCIAALLCCDVATVSVRLLTPHQSLAGLVHLFDLDAEANIPTWFSVIQLAGAAGLLAYIGAVAGRARDPFARHWRALAAIFLFLGLDELAQIHELIEDPLRAALHLDGIWRNAWVLPYALIGLPVGWAYLKFLAHLPSRTRWLMVVAGSIYVGGAAGLEMYGGWLTARLGGEAAARNSVAYLTEVFFEEGMEMTGIALFIYALLEHIRTTSGRMRVAIGPARAGMAAAELDDTQALQVLRSGDRRRSP